MECLNTSRFLSRYVDGATSPVERGHIERHLARCRGCSDKAKELRRMREALVTMPRRSPSEMLQMKLRALASLERARIISRVTFAEKFAKWRERASMTLSHLMRPLMLPVAGGFASACLLFGLLVPDFTIEVHPVNNDVPAPALYTQASMSYLMPIPISDAEIELDVHVDDLGRMTEYHVVKGQNLLRDGVLRRRLESTLLIQQFVPATTFGQPTHGRVRVRVVRDEVDVRG